MEPEVFVVISHGLGMMTSSAQELETLSQLLERTVICGSLVEVLELGIFALESRLCWMGRRQISTEAHLEESTTAFFPHEVFGLQREPDIDH
jgi:hypothetical protein